jgi:acyl carrier protein
MTDDAFMTILRRHLPDAEQRDDVELDVPFVELGFDSMRTIQFLLDLEESFDVVFPEEMLSEELLRSPRTVADALSTLPAAGNTA